MYMCMKYLLVSAEQVSRSRMLNQSSLQVYHKMFSRKVVPTLTFPKLTVSIFQSEVPGWISLCLLRGPKTLSFVGTSKSSRGKIPPSQATAAVKNLRSVLSWFWFCFSLVSLCQYLTKKWSRMGVSHVAHPTPRVGWHWDVLTRLLIQDRTFMWPMSLEQTHRDSHLGLYRSHLVIRFLPK